VAKKFTNKGFSLTEVLMAVGILSIGMMLIATMFPVGIYLTSVGAERTMAAIVADEAFAKIQLFGLDFASPSLPGFNDSGEYELISNPIDPNEFSYPSVDPCSTANSQYYWSALCRPTDLADPNEFQVTVFVARKTGLNYTYPDPANFSNSIGRPRPIEIDCNVPTTDANELIILNGDEIYVNPPTTVVDNATGKIYRVIDRKINDPNVVVLDKAWENTPLSPNDHIWLIPPPDTGGKNADVEVYQRIIRF
jgi:prepilin-type N-terminal cleavage/methylation domain-containing protein